MLELFIWICTLYHLVSCIGHTDKLLVKPADSWIELAGLVINIALTLLGITLIVLTW